MFLSLSRKILYSMLLLSIISLTVFVSTFYISYSSKISKEQEISITRNMQYSDLLHRNILLLKELKTLLKQDLQLKINKTDFPQIYALTSDKEHSNFLLNEQKNLNQRTQLFDENYQTITDGTNFIILSTSFLLSFLLLISYLFNKWILKPINSISDIVEQISIGNLKLRIPLRKNIKFRDELDKLNEIFNMMLDRIENMISTIQDKENFLQTLIDNIPDGVRVIDENYNIVIANKTYYKQSNDTPKISQKCYVSSFSSKRPCVNEKCPLHEIIHKQKQTSLTIQQFASNPHKYLSINTASMQYDKKHKYIVQTIRDLSNDIDFSHQQKISSLNFLSSSIAHEIKNNLGALRIILEHIIEKNKNDYTNSNEYKKMFKTLHTELVNTINIPERLLKMTRYTPQENAFFDCTDSLDEIVKMLDYEAKRKGLDIEYTKPKRDILIKGNETDFKIAIINIMQNAINATSKGKICINVSISTKKGLLIKFSDTGIGISAKDIDYIFTPFYTKDKKSKDLKSSGTGLGLSITKSIVEKFGGKISVKSTLGKGSCFTLSFQEYKKTCNKTKEVL